MNTAKSIMLASAATALIATLVYFRYDYDERPQKDLSTPPSITVSEAKKTPSSTEENQKTDEAESIENFSDEKLKITIDANETDDSIDPINLANAELALVKNKLYEETARSTLPTLSIQTHNPVWELEREAADRKLSPEKDASSESSEPQKKDGPLPSPVSGAFGNIQPPEGEIWLRIPADHASEHRDIMAQNADLYKAETGYDGTVTVTLWVGGRPYARKKYE